MLQHLKSMASRKRLLVITVAEILAIFVATTLLWQTYYRYLGFYPYYLSSVISCGIGVIPATVFLLAVIKMPHAAYERRFFASLVVGLCTSFFATVLLPPLLGQAFDDIPVLLLRFALPAIFPVLQMVAVRKKGKWLTAVCVLAIVFLGLSVASSVLNIVETAQYRIFLGHSIASSCRAVLAAVGRLLFLSSMLPAPIGKQVEELLSVEERLRTVKAQYEAGSLSQEEYMQKKAALLQEV